MPKQYKLSRKSSNRQALINNLVSSLVLHGSIITTATRAKAVKPVAEGVLARAKNLTLANQRYIRSTVNSKAAEHLIKTLAANLNDSSSGLVRIVKVVARKGDAADRANLSIRKKKVVKEVKEEAKKKKS